MADRDKHSNDFEDRFFDLLQGTITGIDGKVDKLERRLEDGLRRIGRLERNQSTKKDEPTAQHLPPWWKDWKNVRAVLYVILAIVVLALAFKGIDATKFIGT